MNSGHRIPYGRQHITEEDIQEVISVLRSDFLTQGPQIEKFEEAFAKYVGSRYAVAVSNGTAALHLCAIALNVDQNSRVITTPITFAASANCVSYCGGEITLVDIDPHTALLDFEKLKALLKSSKPGTYQGIVPVDFAGHSVNLEKFKNLADEYGLWIIEDACHAPGGFFTDSSGIQQKCGNGVYADLSIFSFHPVKHVACGEGGMITTNNEELYQRLIRLRTHGITKDENVIGAGHPGWVYDMVELGYNYRLTDIQCALGYSQLKRADEGLKRRQEIAKRYDEAFEGTKVKSLKTAQAVEHAYHLYVVLVENRFEVYNKLREDGIFCQIHYIPIHQLSHHKNVARHGALTEAENYYEKCLSLPMFPLLTDEQQSYVIDRVIHHTS